MSDARERALRAERTRRAVSVGLILWAFVMGIVYGAREREGAP